MEINHPALVAELTALHDAYEHALVHNDTATLAHLFWDSPDTIRFGVNEHLYGAAAIAAYRSNSPLVLTDRTLLRRTITVFGDHTASVMCEIRQTIRGQARSSRQSQLWVKFPDVGWKITSAHVSNPTVFSNDPWAAYAEQAARALGLPLATEHVAGTALNLARSAQIAAPLLAHALPETVERAAIFTP